MPTATKRNHYVDWVRVLAFFLLIFFTVPCRLLLLDGKLKTPKPPLG